MSPRSKVDLIGVVEAAYAPAGDDATWLATVAKALDLAIQPALGVYAFFLDASDLSHPLISGPETSCLRAPIDVVTASMPSSPEEARTYYSSKYAGTGTGQVGVDAWRRYGHYQQYYKPAGAEDILGVIALDASRSGCVLAVPLQRFTRLGVQQEARYSRAAIHIATALRMRRSLAASSSAADGAEAVLDPGGRVLHAEGSARSAAARSALRTMARDLDAARSTLRKQNPDLALEVWTALVSGRWSLVDYFDTDGRRFLVARQNAPALTHPTALSPLERRVAASIAMGHPQKLLAYELGFGQSTVAKALRDALDKLGLRTASELAAVLGSFASVPEHDSMK